MNYLIDSDVLISAGIGRADALALIEDTSAAGAAVSIISLGEVFEGAVDGIQGEDAPKLAGLRAFLRTFPVLGLDDPTMERFARLRAELRRQGQLIPDLDLLIAASALVHQLVLVTRNTRHFQRIPQLTLRDR